jgi:hypothetical protein
MEYQQITKLTKNKNSKYWETDTECYGEKLFISGSVRTLLDIPKVDESTEDHYIVDIKYSVTKWDSDLPCYVHKVKIIINNTNYKGCIVGDKGMRTKDNPHLSISN